MLLSRAFCLILGTTLFVLVWSMQDGKHRSPKVARSSHIRHVGPTKKRTSVQPVAWSKQKPVKVNEVTKAGVTPLHDVAVVTDNAVRATAMIAAERAKPAVGAVSSPLTAPSKSGAQSLLWMFADEPTSVSAETTSGTTQIAVK